MASTPPDGCGHFSPRDLPEVLRERLQALAFEHGETYASYIAVEDGWETFWNADRTGVVAFVRWLGRYVLVVGGLLAPEDERGPLLDRFMRFARGRRWHVSFWNVGRDRVPLFRDRGFQVTKCGEEPFVRLENATWSGKDYEWLRRQENFCRRAGLEVAEILADPSDPAYRDGLVPRLEAISRAHVAATLHGREMRYFVGRFTPMAMGRRRLFVARRGDDIEAFLVLNPCLGGDVWAIEMYRRREDATRGVVPFAMLQVMRRLREEGVPLCSLSLIPMVRCGMALKGDSWTARGTFVIWWHCLNWLFDVRGIYHFKSRFRPEYRQMYLVSVPGTSVASLVAMGRTWGVLRLGPWRSARFAVREFARSFSRRSLAAPAGRPHRVLRRLAGGPPGQARPEPAEAP